MAFSSFRKGLFSPVNNYETITITIAIGYHLKPSLLWSSPCAPPSPEQSVCVKIWGYRRPMPRISHLWWFITPLLLLFNRDDHDDDKTMIIVDTADGDVDKHDHDDYMTMYLKIFFHSVFWSCPPQWKGLSHQEKLHNTVRGLWQNICLIAVCAYLISVQTVQNFVDIRRNIVMIQKVEYVRLIEVRWEGPVG